MTSSLRVLGLSLLLAGVLSACGNPGANPTPVPTLTGSMTAEPTGPSDAPTNEPETGQTDTAWGRIWDALPPGFPVYPGATPDESAGGGPASAVLVVDGLDAKGVATFLQTLLQRAGWTTVGLSEPLEDGSVVLDMTGKTDGCMLQVSAKPTGGLTTVTILYGAACPFR